MAAIPLDGTEITIIKALGFSSTPITGKILIERCGNMQVGELINNLTGLIGVGFIEADNDNFDSMTIEKTEFNVNSGYIKELKEAIDPEEKPKKSTVRERRE